MSLDQIIYLHPISTEAEGVDILEWKPDNIFLSILSKEAEGVDTGYGSV